MNGVVSTEEQDVGANADCTVTATPTGLVARHLPALPSTRLLNGRGSGWS